MTLAPATQSATPVLAPRAPLAFTTTEYHLLSCPRAQQTGRVAPAFRAITGRRPCPACLRFGAVVKLH